MKVSRKSIDSMIESAKVVSTIDSKLFVELALEYIKAYDALETIERKENEKLNPFYKQEEALFPEHAPSKWVF